MSTRSSSLFHGVLLGAAVVLCLGCGGRNSQIVGSWSGGGMLATSTWSFFDNGECLISARALGIFDPQKMECQWELNGDSLLLTKPDGSGEEEFKIITLTKSNLKVLMPNGQVQEFKRE